MLPSDEHEARKAQYFHDMWNSQAERASTKQRDQVGVLFLRYIFRLDGDTIQDFVSGNRSAYHLVKNDRGRLLESPVGEFWEEVAKVFPEYTAEDISWLTKEGYMPAEVFITSLGFSYPESSILYRILNNLVDRS